MNLSTSGMLSSFRQDVVGRQLSRAANSGGKIYDPTSLAQKSNHETDKQAEENATWFFEYKALLNSKLTTLTTALTSAYTTDLDASMTNSSAAWGGKNAMQGITGTQRDLYGGDGINDTTVIDPGAARTTDAYFNGFGFGRTAVVSGTAINGPYGTTTTEADSISLRMDLTSSVSGAAYTNANARIVGTTTFLSGGSSADKPLIVDRLNINLADNKQNDYANVKTASQIVNPYPSSIEQNKNIGNNVELTLYKFFSKPENYDLIRFGLMDDLYIVGTSSLATGSQIQGSLSLRYTNLDPANNPVSYIEMKQERYSCFFHS